MASKKREGVGYEAIADEIRAKISSGEYPPGHKIPGEKEIIAKYEVGRETAYRALQLLRDEGLTESRQGAPTRVRTFKPVRRDALKRLSSEVWGAGTSMWDVDVLDARPTVIDPQVERVEANAKIAAALGVRRGDPVIRRSRRYALQGKPILRSTTYVPASLAEGTPITEIDTGPGGVYARLAEVGHAPVVFREEVRTRMPSTEEKTLLKLDRGTPVLAVIRTARDASGRVVEVNEMLLDGGSYILDYEFPA
ncbi:GntR family transcriptional regulator [Streptomyces sp. NPDC048252]|uniref:GntR family transcriptional regulator n=1 Tax=Streptomyces sp. NPDC048252 TaxID=3154612 RepID=UPI0034263B2F